MRRRPHAVSLNLVRAAVMLRRSVQPSDAVTCEVSFNLVRDARIDKIQRDRPKFDENGQRRQTGAPRGSMWLDLGPRNGPHGPFEMFELVL